MSRLECAQLLLPQIRGVPASQWTATLPLLAITPPTDRATQDLFHAFGMTSFNTMQTEDLKLGVPPVLLRTSQAAESYLR